MGVGGLFWGEGEGWTYDYCCGGANAGDEVGVDVIDFGLGLWTFC